MATTKKYLDLAGLGIYDGKIKTWVSANFNKYDDTALAGRVTDLETLTNDYATVKSNAANGQTAYTALAAFLGSVTVNAAPTLAQINTAFKTVTINGKRLFNDSYANNAVVLTGADIAVSAADSTTLSTKLGNMDTTISGKADKATTLDGYGIGDAYTKTEVNNAIAGVKTEILGGDITAALKDYDTIKEIAEWITGDETGAVALAGRVSDLEDSVGDLNDNKADKATTLAGYGIGDAYTKTEVNNAIAGVKVSVNGDTGNTYVDVDASVDAAGRAITLTVDESKLSDKITAIESGKTAMSVVNDGVVFTQSDITVSPITEAEINALFA